MDLIVTDWIGMEATALLVQAKREELLRRFPAALVRQAEMIGGSGHTPEEIRAAAGSDRMALQPLGEGGIFTALWQLAEELGTGLEADLRKIPVRQETIEICEYFDLNPYNIRSGGSSLLAADQGGALAERLERAGIPATVIGHTADGNDRLLWNDGSKRYLDRPQRDEIYRIFPEGSGYTPGRLQSGQDFPFRCKVRKNM